MITFLRLAKKFKSFFSLFSGTIYPLKQTLSYPMTASSAGKAIIATSKSIGL
jgi:hypothetical protein